MKIQYILSGTVAAIIGAPLVHQQMTINSINDELQNLRNEMATLDTTPVAFRNWKEIQNEIVEFEKLQKDHDEMQQLEKKVAELKGMIKFGLETLLSYPPHQGGPIWQSSWTCIQGGLWVGA